jgi:hypothetical protein
MKKPQKTTKKVTRKANESPRKATRKPSRKRGRPRKTLAQLETTGGYDRNPGRLLKRMGVRQRRPARDPAEVAAWDEYERRFGPLNWTARRWNNES